MECADLVVRGGGLRGVVQLCEDRQGALVGGEGLLRVRLAVGPGEAEVGERGAGSVAGAGRDLQGQAIEVEDSGRAGDARERVGATEQFFTQLDIHDFFIFGEHHLAVLFAQVEERVGELLGDGQGV